MVESRSRTSDGVRGLRRIPSPWRVRGRSCPLRCWRMTSGCTRLLWMSGVPAVRSCKHLLVGLSCSRRSTKAQLACLQWIRGRQRESDAHVCCGASQRCVPSSTSNGHHTCQPHVGTSCSVCCVATFPDASPCHRHWNTTGWHLWSLLSLRRLRRLRHPFPCRCRRHLFRHLCLHSFLPACPITWSPSVSARELLQRSSE
mmetsp:Transcript_54857/g.146465  ORF Transcript_54857/g.146465 Transcript_54857/m.146465 type:complete len:200 (-) Transcript_54857:1803-2402(-)